MKTAKQDYKPYKAQEELNFNQTLFPMMKIPLHNVDFCKKIGLTVKSVISLLAGNRLTANNFSFFSPEYNQKFTAENLKLKIEKEPDSPNKLQLNLNGINILDWFVEKYREVQQKININKKPEINKSKGIRH